MTPRRWFPQSVGGQLLAMLLLALAVTQGLGLLLLTDERNLAVRAALGLEAAGRAANVALLLRDAPADLQASILRSADSPLVRFAIAADPAADHSSVEATPFLAQIGQIMGSPVPVIRADIHALAATPDTFPEGMPAAMRPMHEAMMAARPEPFELTLSIQLEGGNWLNVRSMFHRPGVQFSPRALLPLILMAAAVALVAWWAARRIVGPIRALAIGADRLGRGLDSAPLSLRGPAEVQDATLAFNRMQDRLTRFVHDRTQMLAALGHDLRSPLTAMRLRVEMLDDSDDATRLRALVGEMQAMVEDTLEFARGVAKTEPAVTIDLATLIADLVGDVGDDRARLLPSAPIQVMVRANALTRSLRNLIDNAIRYGDVAEISLAQEPGMAVIRIADHGPGLPEDQLEAVFEPFVRLEGSRNRDTGGVGLGLAIARTILQAHGGSVHLRNRPEGGLEAVVRLPIEAV